MRFFIRIFFLLSLFNFDVQAQKIEIENYDNKAQAFAILSAQYNNEAYRYSRQNFFMGSISQIKNNCDTAIVFTQIAMEYADSAVQAANDTSVYAKSVMIQAKDFQQKAIKAFELVGKQSNSNIIHNQSEISMYAMANAVADAYEASLYIQQGANMKPKEKPSEGLSTLLTREKKRDIIRLESDEFSFMTVKELYGVRLSEIEDEIDLLENEFRNSDADRRSEITKVIQQLKKEEDEFFDKMKSSEDRLVRVRTELSEEMIKIVNKDVFTTEKEGFYNNVPIPVDAGMPKGLVYKLQIGFFKSQLPSNHFDGIFPLSSEKVDKTYYRYMAGNFEKYDDAKEALKNIHQKGYTDSFVVAYINGEKISINEALKTEKKTN